MLFFYLGTIFAQQQNIIVYYYPTCAGCKFVVDTIKNHGWDDRIKLIDATPKNEKENLRNLRGDGRAAGPFLFDKGRNQKILGSRKIVEYLKKLFE